MGIWLERHFAWGGITNRDEYRRWLPLIAIVELASLWALVTIGERGTINLAEHGWVGGALFPVALGFFVGWTLLTARRLRAADISRAWLLFAILTINLPIGGVHINFSQIAMLVLTVVAAVARDRSAATA